MNPTNWGFIRSLPTFGSAPTDMPDFASMLGAGWNGTLFDYRDPRLAQGIAAARRAGMQYGIWGAPDSGSDPKLFAQQMAVLAHRYNPALLVPDIEFIGKGDPGSEGWKYNQALAQAWQTLMPNQETAVSVMPNQTDFNYEAWGPNVSWMPQAYGADPRTQRFDPEQIIQTLVGRGVDPSRIMPVLAPGQHHAGPSALWTVDDLIGHRLPDAYRGPRPPRPEDGYVPMPDSQNPRAVEYAQRRLGQLKRLGVIGSIPQGDPTAAWRAASGNIAEIARQRGYSDPRAFLRSADRPRKGKR